jgi:hypothetical protein
MCISLHLSYLFYIYYHYFILFMLYIKWAATISHYLFTLKSWLVTLFKLLHHLRDKLIHFF